MQLLDPQTWNNKLFINGWTEGRDAPITVQQPATGEELGSVASASREDVLSAAAKAAAAQKEWAAKTPRERAAVLRRAGQLFEEHA